MKRQRNMKDILLVKTNLKANLKRLYMHLSKPKECTPEKVDPNVNCGF